MSFDTRDWGEQHEILVELYSKDFVGREQELKILENYVAARKSTAVMLTGKPGQGKSTLLAQFTKICRKKFPEILTIPHFVGSIPLSKNISSLLNRVYRELQLRDNIVPSGIDAYFQHLLYMLDREKHKRILLVVDEIDLFNLGPMPDYLFSLLANLPENVDIVFSVSRLSLMASMPHLETIRLTPLSSQEAESILQKHIGKNAKKHEKELIEKYKNNPLLLEALARKAQDFPKREFAEEFPQFLEQLFDLLEENHDSSPDWKIIPLAFGFICGSQGIYRDELDNLMQKELKETVDSNSPEYQKQQRELADRLRKLLDQSQRLLLLAPNNGGQKISFRSQINPTVSQRYLLPHRREIHKKLAVHYQQKSSLSEYTYHLWQAGESEELYLALSGRDFNGDLGENWEQYEKAHLCLYHGLRACATDSSCRSHYHLCDLALRTGKLFSQAQVDMNLVFSWARQGEAKRCLVELQTVSREHFFLSIIAILWQEADLPQCSQQSSRVKILTEALERRITPGPTPVNWSSFLQRSFMVWWGEKVLNILDEKELIKIIQRGGIKNSDYVLEVLIKSCIERKKWEQAIELSNGIEAKRPRSASILELSKALAKEESVCEKVHTQIKDQSVYLEYRDREPALLAMGRIWRKTKTVESIQTFVQNFCDNEESKKDLKQIYILQVIAGEELKIENSSMQKELMNSLLQAIRGIFKDIYKIPALSALALQIVKFEKQRENELLEQMLESIGELKKSYHRAQLFLDIAAVLVSMGNVPRARRLFNKVQMLVSNVEDREQVKILSMAVKTVIKLENESLKPELLQQMANTAKKFADAESKAKAISEIVQILTDIKCFDGALVVVKSVKNKEQWGRLISGIAHGLSVAGDIEQAERLFSQIFDSARKNENSQEKSAIIADLVQIIAKTGDVDQVKLMREAVELTKKIPHDLYKFAVLSKVVRSVALLEDKAGKAALLQLSLKIAKKIGDAEYKSEVLSAFSLALLQAGEIGNRLRLWQRLLKITRKIPNDLYRSSAISQISQTLAQEQNFPEQWKLFRILLKAAYKIEPAEYKSKILPVISQAISRSQLSVSEQNAFLRQILEAANKLPQDFPRQYLLVAMAKNLMQLKEFPDRNNLLQKIANSIQAVKNPENRTACLGTVSQILGETKDFAQAMKAVEEIEDNIQKFSVLLNLIQANIQSGDIETRKSLQQMIEMAQSIDRGWDQSKILLEISKNFVLLGDFRRALETAEIIGDSICKTYALLRTVEAISTIRDHAEKPDLLECALTYARELEDDYEQSKSKALCKIAQVFARDDEEKALAIAQKIANPRYKSEALLNISQCLIQEDENKARELFQQALVACFQINRSECPADIASGLVKTLARAEKIEEAQTRLAKINDSRHRFRAWFGLIEGVVRMGKKDLAATLFSKTLDELEKSRSRLQALLETIKILYVDKSLATTDNLLCISEFIQGLEDGDKPEGLSEFIRFLNRDKQNLQMMTTALRALDNVSLPWDKVNIYFVIARTLGQEGHIQKSLEIIGKIDTQLYKSRAICKLVHYLSRSRNFDKALSIAQSIEDKGCKSQALCELAIGLAFAGEFEQAAKVCEEVEFPQHNIKAALQIALALSRKGQGHTEQYIRKAEEKAENMPDPASSQSEIAIAYAQIGELQKATELISKIKREMYRSQAIVGVSRELAKSGREKEGIFAKIDSLAREIKFCKSRGKALAAIAESIAACENFERALKTALGIESDRYQADALAKIAKMLVKSPQRKIMSQFLHKSSLSRKNIAKAVRMWQKELLENSSDPVSEISDSLKIFPGNYSLAVHGVYMLQLAHARQGNWEHYQKIRECLDTWQAG